VGDLLTPVHLIIVLGIALLVFGPKRLPELGAGLGKSLREFREATSGVTTAFNQQNFSVDNLVRPTTVTHPYQAAPQPAVVTPPPSPATMAAAAAAAPSEVPLAATAPAPAAPVPSVTPSEVPLATLDGSAGSPETTTAS